MMRNAFLMLLLLGVVCPGPGYAQEQRTPIGGATYFRIPVAGKIGEEEVFTPKMMASALQRARELSPTVVVLDIDTPGGNVPPATMIVNQMIRARDLRCVALVRRAMSAGAIIALTCPEIYMTDTSKIGAATLYFPDTVPDAVLLKSRSDWRATGRMAAERGGHSPLLPEAMMAPDFVLTGRRVGNKVVLERDGQGEVLNARGQILTLTPTGAVQWGLARGKAQSIDGLGEALGFSDWSDIEKPDDFAVNAPPADDFYGMFTDKAASLRLIELLTTSLQRTVAFENFTAWFKRRALIGRRVGWGLRLVDADIEIGRSLVEICEKRVELAEANLREQESTAYEDKAVPDFQGSIYKSTYRVLTPDGARRVRESKRVLDRCRRDLGKAKRVPLLIQCISPTHARLRVFAQASEKFAGELVDVPPGGRLRLVGKIVDIQCGPLERIPGTLAECIFKQYFPWLWEEEQRSKDHSPTQLWEFVSEQLGTAQPGLTPAFSVAVIMTDCVTGKRANLEGEATRPDAPASPEEQARGLLTLAEAYEASGLSDKAKAMLRRLIAELPETEVAEKARNRLGDPDASAGTADTLTGRKVEQ
jgi:hypothetical protein